MEAGPLAVALPALRAEVEVEPAARASVEGPLLAAAVRRFERLAGRSVPPLRMRASTTIPECVGLAGSSAIVVAALRALARTLHVELAPETLATAALEAETEELGIVAGPQDRVVQAHGGLVAMDFTGGPGAAPRVERLDPALLPPLFVAWQRRPAASSTVFHAELRARYEAGDRAVRDGMDRLARLASEARDALVAGDREAFARCVDGSFDARREMAALEPAHVRMVELARSLGAAANFTGSGGAVVGTVPAGVEEAELATAFAGVGCAVHVPARRD
jgi:glucuronokinase